MGFVIKQQWGVGEDLEMYWGDGVESSLFLCYRNKNVIILHMLKNGGHYGKK